MTCELIFPGKWINADAFEKTIKGNPHSCGSQEVTFRFYADCKLMVDVCIRILSLANQLHSSLHRVKLIFDDGEDGVMGYLNRIGFFDCLDPGIEVSPARPTWSGAAIHRGGNMGLVEIARINKNLRDKTIHGRLAEAVGHACVHRADVSSLEEATWTIFSELIDNIFSHSQTPLDGYAALQRYSNGNEIKIAVSDSGLGILQTLRPALASEFPTLTGLTDTQLIVEIFRQGLSRHGTDRGCGLRGSAAKAIKFQADLEVRLPNSRVVLKPSRQAYTANTAHCYESLPLMWGTHITFSLKLT